MEQSCFRNWLSTSWSRNFPFLWNLEVKVRYHVAKPPPLDAIVSQLKQLHTLTQWSTSVGSILMLSFNLREGLQMDLTFQLLRLKFCTHVSSPHAHPIFRHLPYNSHTNDEKSLKLILRPPYS
jgi:hypothetical protein